MKKLFAVILSALTLCVSFICLFGCGKSIKGKYMLTGGGGQVDGGPLIGLLKQDENGLYENVNGGFMVPDQFWVEIKGKTMTVHGSISPVVSELSVTFNANAENIHTIENFKLETYPYNQNWYSIIDEKGEDTLWRASKNGKLLDFDFGTSGIDDFYYGISYEKK